MHIFAVKRPLIRDKDALLVKCIVYESIFNGNYGPVPPFA